MGRQDDLHRQKILWSSDVNDGASNRAEESWKGEVVWRNSEYLVAPGVESSCIQIKRLVSWLADSLHW